MNKEFIYLMVLLLRKYKKSDIAIENAKEKGMDHDYSFGVGYNKAIDDIINALENGEI